MASRPELSDGKVKSIWIYISNKIKEKKEPVTAEEEFELIRGYIEENTINSKWTPIELLKHFNKEIKKNLHLQNWMEKKDMIRLMNSLNIPMKDDWIDKDSPSESETVSIHTFKEMDENPLDELFSNCRCTAQKIQEEHRRLCSHCSSLPTKTNSKKKGQKFTVQEKSSMAKYVFDIMKLGISYKSLETGGSEFWREYCSSGYHKDECSREPRVLSNHWCKQLVCKAEIYKCQLDPNIILHLFQSIPVRMNDVIKFKLENKHNLTIITNNETVVGWKTRGVVKKGNEEGGDENKEGGDSIVVTRNRDSV